MCSSFCGSGNAFAFDSSSQKTFTSPLLVYTRSFLIRTYYESIFRGFLRLKIYHIWRILTILCICYEFPWLIFPKTLRISNIGKQRNILIKRNVCTPSSFETSRIFQTNSLLKQNTRPLLRVVIWVQWLRDWRWILYQGNRKMIHINESNINEWELTLIITRKFHLNMVVLCLFFFKFEAQVVLSRCFFWEHPKINQSNYSQT